MRRIRLQATPLNPGVEIVVGKPKTQPRYKRFKQLK